MTVFDALEASNTITELQLLFREEIAKHGYSVSACGAFLPTDNGPEPHFFFVDWPEDWIRIYQERNFVANDFGVAEARQRIAPFTWLEAKAARVLSAGEREVWSEAASFGWEDGFSVPIHGPAGYFGLVTMGGKRRVLTQDERRHLKLLAFETHDRCRALTGLDPVTGPRAALTARELESLRWVSCGRTDAQIAGLLSISVSTVKSHVDSARHKLNARTRAHACARMIVCGLG
jgi:DNA-binding CsgD family transcriptional regulator